MIYLLFSRKTIAKKLKTISQKLSLNYNSSLFGLEISKKEINEIKHSGSFENIDEANIFLHSIKNDFEIYIVYKPWKDYDLFKGGKQKILLNRDILVNKLNWNKQHARHTHYLMLIYSNYQSEEFYNRNYKENIRYFLELEKYNQD
ncbi:hypothetical protein NPA08_03785 [Mycoplasmopsis citelli]|uniref:hypothetical protein n=1 Tax=Mycoplasmopsis citelli TaxID=171281 RepID=UPI002114319B|nr:hypothetical protein [Mycoplasmopsis citelli]UUD36048.1 hypothetical protein NPA08_03785 [Mycoplasmopsis citelli]